MKLKGDLGYDSPHESKKPNGSRTQADRPGKSSALCRPNQTGLGDDESVHGPDAMVEIFLRHLLVAALRDFDPNVFHCVRPRHHDATFVGRTGILVLLVRRGTLVDRI